VPPQNRGRVVGVEILPEFGFPRIHFWRHDAVDIEPRIGKRKLRLDAGVDSHAEALYAPRLSRIDGGTHAVLPIKLRKDLY
jgi:hypothetical protein